MLHGLKRSADRGGAGANIPASDEEGRGESRKNVGRRFRFVHKEAGCADGSFDEEVCNIEYMTKEEADFFDNGLQRNNTDTSHQMLDNEARRGLTAEGLAEDETWLARMLDEPAEDHKDLEKWLGAPFNQWPDLAEEPGGEAGRLDESGGGEEE